MKLVVAGGREMPCEELVREYLDSFDPPPTEVISGGARGADAFGEEWARHHGIPVRVFTAEWKRFGVSAGPIRNRAMAEYADRVVAFWDGASRGTANMIAEAKRAGKPCRIIRYDRL